MRLVSRNAKKGAQFTPQGILRWPLTSALVAVLFAPLFALLALSAHAFAKSQSSSGAAPLVCALFAGGLAAGARFLARRSGPRTTTTPLFASHFAASLVYNVVLNPPG